MFFAITVMSRVTRGLRELAVSARQVADGDYSVRVNVPGRDEVSTLAGSFNVMAEQLLAAEQQREELEKLRRDLIAWTSHDLRTPLTSIRAMIEALHDGIVTDPLTVTRYYATIRNDIIGLNTLIDDLFELAQLDTGGLRMDPAVHHLGDVISDALERFQALAAERGIALTGRVGPTVDPVTMDAARIERVVNNLLSNALSYTPAGGAVTIDAHRDGSQVVVTVQDSGPGFAAADLPRVFEKFYRGEQARSRSNGNAGLGLAIARGIVEAHGGRIWAANAVPGGAIVSFQLPAQS
jgi:signal transduction histidine kinase